MKNNQIIFEGVVMKEMVYDIADSGIASDVGSVTINRDDRTDSIDPLDINISQINALCVDLGLVV